MNKLFKELKIIDFNLSIRVKNILTKNEIIYVSQLLKMSPNDLMKFERMGKKSVDEIFQFFRSFYFKHESFIELSHELIKLNNNPSIKFDSKILKKILLPCCDSKYTEQEIFDKIKFIITSELFKEKVNINKKLILDFIKEEINRSSLRKKYGITDELYYKVKDF